MYRERRKGVVDDAATDRVGGGTAAARRTVASRVDGTKVLADALRQLPVTVRFWDDSMVVARDDPDAPVVLIRDEQAIAHFLRAPNQLGLGRAWVSGALDVDGDLERVLGLRQRVGGLSLGPLGRARLAAAALRVAGPRALRRPPIPASEAAPAGRLHSKRRDRASVRHHYDVSNRFYELLLGPSLVYSCAYFADAGDSLERAQERKLELICRKLRLQPGERLLDIGCGWGSLVLHAAARHGVRALGVTLSEPQAELARRRIEAAGLSDRAEVRVLDYREIDEAPFDKIASVGMYEHVGRAQLDTYVEAVHTLLRPGGLFLNHGITRLNASPPRGPDLHQPLRVPGRRAAPGQRHHLRAGRRRLRGSRRRIDARALRADAALLAPQPGRQLRRGRRGGGDGARARVAALHARLGTGLRDRRDRHLPDACGARGRPAPAAARPRGAVGR